MTLTAIIPTVAIVTDQHLEEGMIFTLPATHHQVAALTATLDTPTTRQVGITMDPPSPSHSWRGLTISNLMKLKSSMKQLKNNYNKFQFKDKN